MLKYSKDGTDIINVYYRKQKSEFLSCFLLSSQVLLPFLPNAPMMGLIGAGNNPMVGMTVACAVAVNEALNK